MSLLTVDSISKSFGGLRAVDNVSFTVEPGEIVGVIGPNGAGKSTLFNLISGFVQPDSGGVDFMGERITGISPHVIAAKGLVKTFQLVRPFGSMDLRENVMVPFLVRGLSHRESARQSDALIERFGLRSMADALPSELPYALRRRLEIARALGADPKLLLLDEALAGLTSLELAELLDILRELRRDGVTLLLIEHVMAATMALCDRIVVLNFGRLLASGTPAEVASHEGVIEAYLGRAH